MSGPGLGCRDLTFGYRRGAPDVIRALSADFPAGTVTVVTGESGSGKSTLMYVLSLLLRPRAGQVLWDGADLAGSCDGERSGWRARHAGFVFQDAMLDPSRTVLDNVCEPAVFSGVPRREAVRRAEDLLERFGVAHRARHRPGEVSGGQAQRVGLCRALLMKPDVIFGDEPTGNLDATSAAVVWRALKDRARAGAVVVVATHGPALAEDADHCLDLG